jgi:WS/DGAT/MGAT family acyltransferase
VSVPPPTPEPELATSYAVAEDGSLLHRAALLWFDGPVEHDELLRVVERAVRANPVLRTRPARMPLAGGLLGWSVDGAFRATRHVRTVEIDTAPDERALAHAAGVLLSRPLPLDRPPWQLDLLVDRHGRGLATLVRGHPALARDGVAAFVGALLGASALRRPYGLASPEELERRGGIVPSLLRAATALAEHGARGSRALAAEVRGLFRPGVALARTREMGRMLESAGTLLSSPAPETPWNGTLGSERAVAWLSLSLDALRGIAEGFAGDWYDAWLTVVADALGRLLRDRGRPTGDLTLLAFVPRPRGSRDASERAARAVDDVAALVALPVGELAPAARHALVRASRIDPLSRSRGDGLAQLAALAQRLPEPLHSLLGSLCFQAANVLVANEAAPRAPLLVGRRRVTSLVPLAALPWHVGLALTALETADALLIGVSVDPSLVADVADVVRALHDAYVELATAAGVPPVPGRDPARASR